MVTSYRQVLNNYLQTNYKNQTTITWNVMHEGPKNAGLWTAIAYINSEEYGRASLNTVAAAKEEAARQTLTNLRGY